MTTAKTICKKCNKETLYEPVIKHNSKLNKDIIFFKKGSLCFNCKCKMYGIVPKLPQAPFEPKVEKKN